MNVVNIKSSHATKSLDESMIPAINIVFLLLIFFMIAGHIEASKEQLVLPNSSSETELAQGEVEIQVTAQGQYFLNGIESTSDLYLELQELKVTQQTVIVTRVHRELPAHSLDPILKAVRQLGIHKLSIATEQAQ